MQNKKFNREQIVHAGASEHNWRENFKRISVGPDWLSEGTFSVFFTMFLLLKNMAWSKMVMINFCS